MSDAGGGRRDIELRIRAVDNTKADLQSLVKTINDVSAALHSEMEAAAAGKRSNDELRQSVTQLEQAQKSLAGIGALVDQYRNLTTQIEASNAAVTHAAAAQNAYQSELSQTENVTREQQRSLANLNREREKSERILRQQVGMLETVGNDLRRAGIDTHNLAQAERDLLGASEQLRTSLGPLRDAHANNARVIREQREETARLREEEQKRVNEGRRVAQAGQQADTSIINAKKRIADEEKKREEESLQIQSRLEAFRRKQAADTQAEAERQAKAAAAAAEKRTQEEVAAAEKRAKATAEAAKRAEESIQAGTKRGSAQDSEYQQMQARLEALRRKQAAERQAEEERQTRAAAAEAEKRAQAAASAAKRAEDSIIASLQRIATEQKKKDDEYFQMQSRLEGLRRKQASDRQAEEERQTRVAAAEAEKRARAEAAAAEARAALVARAEASIQAAKRRNATEEERREQEFQQTQMRLEALRRRQISERQAQEQRNQQALQRDRERIQREAEAAARRAAPGGAAAVAAAPGQQTLFGLRPYELQNLSYQLNDVFTQLASGTRVSQVFAQQGGQIFQLFGRNLFDLLPYLPRVAAGIGVITVAIQAMNIQLRDISALREYTALLKTMGDGANYSAPKLVELERQIKRIGLSAEDTRKIISSGLAAGIGENQILPLANIARDIAVPRGQEPAKVFDDLAKAIHGGLPDLIAWNAQIGNGILKLEDLAELRTVNRTQGGPAALARALELLSQRTQGAADESGTFTKELKELSNAWDDFLRTLGGTGAIKTAIDALKGLIEQTTGLVHALDTLAKFIDSSPGIKWLAENGPSFANTAREFKNIRDFFFGAAPDPNNTGWQTAARAQQAGAFGQAAFINRLPVDTEELKKAIEALTMATRTAGLPAGYRVEVISTERPGATVAGTGEPSEHGKGRAVDVRIVDANGQPIPGSMGLTPRGADTTGLYAKLDAAFEAFIKERYPALPYAVGSRFSREPDPGHYSVGAGREQANQAAREQRTNAPFAMGPPTAAQADASKEQLRIDQLQYDVRFDINQQRARAAILAQAELEADQKKLVLADRQEFINRRLVDFDVRRAETERKFQQDLANQRLSDGKNAEAINRAGEEARAKAIANAKGLLTLEQAQTAEMQGREEARKKFANEEAARAAQRKIDQDLNNAAIQVGLKGYTDVNKQLDLIRDKQRIDRERVTKDIEDARGKGQTVTDRPDLRTQVENRQLAQAEVDIRLKEIETLAQNRQQTIAAVNASVESGGMTISEGQAAIKRAFEATTPEIEAQTKAFQEFIATNKDIDPTKIDQLTAKVKQLRAESQYISPLWKTIKDTFESSFASNAVAAFNTIGEAIGGLIAKTKTWGDVWRSVQTATANFFAGLLKDLASEVLKAELKKLASSLFGGASSSGGGIFGTLFGSIFGGASSNLAGATLGTASTAAPVAVSTLNPGVAALFHQGGVVGLTSTPTRAWQADWTRGAPRYHNGTVVGLAPNEQAAILQRGEEVLTRNDPRNALNRMGTGGGRDLNIRSILVADPSYVPTAMASAQGERIVVQHLVKNAATVRQLIKG